jgi:hypothetical protein
MKYWPNIFVIKKHPIVKTTPLFIAFCISLVKFTEKAIEGLDFSDEMAYACMVIHIILRGNLDHQVKRC